MSTTSDQPRSPPQLPAARRRRPLLIGLLVVLAAVIVFIVVLASSGGGGSSKIALQRPGLQVIPFPGTPDASPQSQLIFPAVSSGQFSSIDVTGSSSGRHSGHVAALPGGRGAAFVPDRPFSGGEHVQVRASLNGAAAAAASGAGSGHALTFSFTVAAPPPPQAKPATPLNSAAPAAKPPPQQSFHSRPDLKPTTVAVKGAPAPGSDMFFVDPVNTPQAGPMILDNQGRTVWTQPLTNGDWAFDFREQAYQGKPVLTWFEGKVVLPGFGTGRDVILDSSYRPVATVQGAEGYQADLHEFLLTAQNTALITSYVPVRADLSSVGGTHNGILLDNVVQEIDVATGQLLWEWHALGHVPLSESHAGKAAAGAPYDFFHINSIEPTADGNLIVSSRSTWTIYKIDRRTGAILWRLGGRRSSFRMGPGTQFEFQHDARLHPDGTLSLFNNAADPPIEKQSRAMVLRLDTTAMTATLAKAFAHTPTLLAGSQGNTQLTPGGDVVVGWGAQPAFSEYTADGRQIFDGEFPGKVGSYRAYRSPWLGRPTGPPSLSVSAGAGKHTAYASWNGETGIAAWRLSAGASPSALTAANATVPSAGFETALAVSGRPVYVSAEALDAGGHVLGRSTPVRVGG